DVSLVSFGTTKPGGVAEGALLLARDEALAARIAGLARFGIGAGQVGLNGHVSELHAAAMLAALDELDGTIARRRAVAQALRADVGALGARLQGGADGSAWQFLNVALPSAAARAAAREAAADRDVATRTLWAP